MAAIRATRNTIIREIFRPGLVVPIRRIANTPVRCAASASGHDTVPQNFRHRHRRLSGQKPQPRLSQVHKLLLVDEGDASTGRETIPKISLGNVSVKFAKSGGGQNLKEVMTRVDMGFNVRNANWLSERVRGRLMQMEKNRITNNGELVLSAKKIRGQKDNIEDALEKLQVQKRRLQAILDAACYAPPPLSEKQAKAVAKLTAIAEQKRLQKKKALAQKKAF